MQPYLSPPTVCEPLARMVERFEGACELTTPHAGPIVYPLPVHAAEELRDFLRRWSDAAGLPGMMAQLPGGRVFGEGIVLSPDGRSIARDVSPDFGKPSSDHWLLTFKKIRPPADLAGAVAVIATTLGTGYSHWLLEELPRLLMLARDAAGTIIGHGATVFSQEALRLHGFSGRWVEAVRETHYACERLVIPVLPGEAGQPVPQTLARLDEFASPLFTRSSVFGEKIFISRAKARRRRVTNEAELWSRLEAQGFARVQLETLTWAEQINAFRHARVIVAPHGAGLANLVFCREGTRVVEFFHREYVNPCFWRVAALRGLDYRPVVPPAGPSLAYEGRAGRVDIAADNEIVLRAISCD